MIDITKILFDICEDERVYDSDYDLFESGLMDSYAFISLFSTLEDYGIEIFPTRINRELLRTPRGIQKLVDDYLEKGRKS